MIICCNQTYSKHQWKAYLFSFQMMHKSQFPKMTLMTGFVVQGHKWSSYIDEERLFVCVCSWTASGDTTDGRPRRAPAAEMSCSLRRFTPGSTAGLCLCTASSSSAGSSTASWPSSASASTCLFCRRRGALQRTPYPLQTIHKNRNASW